VADITGTTENIAHRSPDPGRLEHALQALVRKCLSFNGAVATGVLENFGNAQLFPAETVATDHAHPRRQATFRGGRTCARAALNELGVSPIAIPVGASGAPQWPKGFVGSISHTDKVAASVVARNPPIRGIGLDIEGDEPLDNANMLQIVCLPGELLPGCEPGEPANLRRGKLLFVVKEAVYKLYRPLTGSFLDFRDLQVTLDETDCSFRAILVDPCLPMIAGARTIAGCFASAGGFVVAIAVLAEDG
jgi:4'-phosphopantetheinyl transferase EntD